jgi:hypothetical protein
VYFVSKGDNIGGCGNPVATNGGRKTGVLVGIAKDAHHLVLSLVQLCIAFQWGICCQLQRF